MGSCASSTTVHSAGSTALVRSQPRHCDNKMGKPQTIPSTPPPHGPARSRTRTASPSTPPPQGPARSHTENLSGTWTQKDVESESKLQFEDMKRRCFEFQMLVRCKIQNREDLEHVRHETNSLISVIESLRSASSRDVGFLQVCRIGSGQDYASQQQEDAALSLSMARLRQHIRIKIADTEDLICAHQAMVEVSSFFDALDQMALQQDEYCCYQLFVLLMQEP
jgi:hypothetical protein